MNAFREQIMEWSQRMRSVGLIILSVFIIWHVIAIVIVHVAIVVAAMTGASG